MKNWFLLGEKSWNVWFCVGNKVYCNKDGFEKLFHI